ncbi:MAG: hypothetical protein Q4A43_03285 [Coriobacteriia bacterium]|nr:hypothetical protein [Coriobacteriia bacterium]
MAGDLAGFAKACGEYARNDVLRALNETIMANAKRDRSKGVRFARVTTGRETCTFCLMLASRGAVYHSRQSAGEFRHFHRHCDCKVVPGFEDDPMAELVQGHDPKDELRRWQRVENKTVITDELHELSRKEIVEEAVLLDKLAKRAHEASFDELTRVLSSSGAVSFEEGSVPKGKELQVTKWLASVGWDSLFRNEIAHFDSDGNTSDLLIDAETWDVKRITSSNPNKIAQAIFKKKYQGPNYVIDLSLSDMSESEALAKCASILDDDRVGKIALIMSKKLMFMKR